MKIKFKKLIVISLVFTIIFNVLPTITCASSITANDVNYTQKIEDYINNQRPINSSDQELEKSDYDFWLGLAQEWCQNNNITVETQEGQYGGELKGQDGSSVELSDIFDQIDSQINDNLDLNINGKYNNIDKNRVISLIRSFTVDNNIQLYRELVINIGEKNGVDVTIPDGEEVGFIEHEIHTLENIGMFLSGIAKVIYFPVKFIIFLIPGGVIQAIIEGIASIGGNVNRSCYIR